MYNGASGGELSYSLKDIFQVLWKRLWIIALVTLLCVGAAVGYSLWQTPVYEATATMVVNQDTGTTGSSLQSSVEGLSQITGTMQELVESRPVAEGVIQQQNLNMTAEGLLGHLTTEQVGSSQFLELHYTDPDPQRAQQIVNAIGEVSSDQAPQTFTGTSAITARLYEPAVVPDTPASPDPARNGLLALALGLMLGVGLAFLLEYLDDSWRSSEEVEQVSGVPTFGVIPEFKAVKAKR